MTSAHSTSSRKPSQHAVEGGCIAASSAADAVKDADVVITMLPAAKHVRAVFDDDVAPNAKPGALLIDCSTIDVASAREVGEGHEEPRASTSSTRRFRAASPQRRPEPDLHGRRDRRAVRARQALPRADGQGRDPRRPARRRAGGEDLQQHDPRRDDGRDLRSLRPRAEARARPAGLLRHFVQGVGPKLVDDELRAGPRRRPGHARPITITKAGSPPR